MKTRNLVAQIQKDLAAAGAPFDKVVEVGLWFDELPPVEFDPRTVQREIVEGAARGAYVSAVMTFADEMGYRFQGGAGAPNIEDQIRPTPRRVLTEAREWATQVAKRSGRPLWIYYLYAVNTPGKHVVEPTPHAFGFAMVWQSQGSGVRWDDHHPKPIVSPDRLPSFEYYDIQRSDMRGLEREKRR